MEAGVDIVWHYRANFPPSGEHCDIGFEPSSPSNFLRGDAIGVLFLFFFFGCVSVPSV